MFTLDLNSRRGFEFSKNRCSRIPGHVLKLGIAWSLPGLSQYTLVQCYVFFVGLINFWHRIGCTVSLVSILWGIILRSAYFSIFFFRARPLFNIFQTKKELFTLRFTYLLYCPFSTFLSAVLLQTPCGHLLVHPSLHSCASSPLQTFFAWATLSFPFPHPHYLL